MECCLCRGGQGVKFNSLPNNKILDWSKFKAFADDKFTVARLMISVVFRTENIVGKGENVGYQHFLLSLRCLNPLPHMPILGSSNSAANKDMMSKTWTNGDTII